VMRRVSQLRCLRSETGASPVQGADAYCFERWPVYPGRWRPYARVQGTTRPPKPRKRVRFLPGMRGARPKGGHEAGSLGMRVRFPRAPRGRRSTGGYWFRTPVMRVRFPSAPLCWSLSESASIGIRVEAGSTPAASSTPACSRRRRPLVRDSSRFDSDSGLHASMAHVVGHWASNPAKRVRLSLLALRGRSRLVRHLLAKQDQVGPIPIDRSGGT
jgi:hypothetical protein